MAGQQPVLAGGAVSSGLTVNFSEAERGVTAIIACPLHVEAATADILYTTVPHECGTLDWLALVTLAGEQYKKAELQIEARKTSRDNAAIQHELQTGEEDSDVAGSAQPHGRGVGSGDRLRAVPLDRRGLRKCAERSRWRRLPDRRGCIRQGLARRHGRHRSPQRRGCLDQPGQNPWRKWPRTSTVS